MLEYKLVFEEGNDKCRQSGLDTEPPQVEFGPAWMNTAAKGNYRQVEKLSRMEKRVNWQRRQCCR